MPVGSIACAIQRMREVHVTRVGGGPIAINPRVFAEFAK
jgi:hypothetical protein